MSVSYFELLNIIYFENSYQHHIFTQVLYNNALYFLFLCAVSGAVEARSLSDAIEVLSIGEFQSTDRHPEKRLKAAYLEFEARELPILKAEYPNMRLSQLKQMLWKEWQKSPDNPMNQR